MPKTFQGRLQNAFKRRINHEVLILNLKYLLTTTDAFKAVYMQFFDANDANALKLTFLNSRSA